MALLARLTDVQPNGERRQEGRRKLQLAALTAYAGSANGVMILDLSSTGLMIETAIPLHVGESIQVELPRAEPQAARVIWQRETYFGCEFAKPVAQAIISAALLRSPALNAPFQQAEAVIDVGASHEVARSSPSPSGLSPWQPTSPLLTSLSLCVLGGAVGLLLLGLLLI